MNPHGSTNNRAFSSSSALQIPDGTTGGYTIQIDRYQFNKQGQVKLDMNFKRLAFTVAGASQVKITINAENRRSFEFMVIALGFRIKNLYSQLTIYFLTQISLKLNLKWEFSGAASKCLINISAGCSKRCI